jgi:hypothetical protein
MSRSAFKHLRLLGPLTVAATLSIGTLPAFAQTAPASTPVSSGCSAIHFELANPSAASELQPGGLVVQGIAMDSRAQQGLGIDRVDFFLDSREAGGMSIGTAVPGLVPGPFGPTSFQTTISVPSSMGGHDLFAYAHSSVNGAESVISLPVSVGEDPSKSLQTLGETATMSCMGGSTMLTTSPTTPTTPATTTTTTPATQPSTTTTTPAIMSVAPTASSITLSVGNPSPNDTIKTGAYSIQGDAFDKAATSGTGIDRIDIFLDNRDTGGMFLSTATLGTSSFWQSVVTLPNNQTGLHELWFYAHSSVTGQTMSVSVPVTISH